MTKTSILILVLVSGFACFGQHANEFFNDGALVHVQAGAEVHVWGDVHNVQATGDLQNNGLIKMQGNAYSDNLFQQSGTGIYRVENSDVNIGERQFISGSYAVRGGQALTSVDDGSFFDLQLANDQGIVYLVGVGNIADVRNSVNYNPLGGVPNRILTHDVGMVGAVVPPANGSLYSAVFGLMNPTPGIANMINNTVSVAGNMSGVDNGYVQGKFRRAIAPAGGQYNYVEGLEPAGAGAQRGMQYIRVDLAANNYDVITSYFETASPNTSAVTLECSGTWMNYWGGADHGEWMFSDITGAGAGAYEMWVWPQDDNYPVGTVWAITKDNALVGTANDCGPSPVGLSRAGFNGFTGISEFDVATDIIILPIELIDINATGIIDHIDVVWNVASESDLSHYELERSEDGVDFQHITSVFDVAGNTSQQQSYDYSDFDVRYFQNFYYRVKTVDTDGNYDYTPIVMASLKNANGEFSEEMVSIYPNPSSSDFMISIHSDETRDLSMSVFNSLGQIIQERSTKIQKGNTVMNIISNEWATGIYHIQLLDLNSGQTINKKFIKK
jgi:hypothetical protein